MVVSTFLGFIKKFEGRNMYHEPVLLKECIEGLNIKEDGIYVDVTYGGGGHSKEILKHFQSGSLIAFDQDQDALKNKLDDERLVLINHNFRYMREFPEAVQSFSSRRNFS